MRFHQMSWVALCCVIFTVAFAEETICQVPIGYFTDVRKLGPNISAEGTIDTLQAVSPDGLTIIFTSFSEDGFDREGGFGGADLYQATRASVEEPFGPAMNLGPDINTSAFDNFPSLSSDLLTLYFASTRGGNFDLYQATRPTIDDTFGSVTNLGSGVNTGSVERGPNVSPDGLTLFFGSNRSGGEGGDDFYMATRDNTSEPFEHVTSLGTDVNSPFGEFVPSVSSDGLFLFFSDFFRAPFRPDGHGDSDIWVAVRDSVDASFSDVVNLNDFSLGSDVNREFRENAPLISHDWPSSGSRLYFSSQPDGDLDIWQATWVSADCDGDGVLDTKDVDCASVARNAALGNRLLAEIGIVTGDADGNGLVEFSDFLVLSNNFNAPGTYTDGDFDFDGTVAFSDFLLLSSNFHQGGAASQAVVPEPQARVWLIIAMFGVVRWQPFKKLTF